MGNQVSKELQDSKKHQTIKYRPRQIQTIQSTEYHSIGTQEKKPEKSQEYNVSYQEKTPLNQIQNDGSRNKNFQHIFQINENRLREVLGRPIETKEKNGEQNRDQDRDRDIIRSCEVHRKTSTRPQQELGDIQNIMQNQQVVDNLGKVGYNQEEQKDKSAENYNVKTQSVEVKIQQKKPSHQKKEYNWGNYKLEENQRMIRASKNKNKKQKEVIVLDTPPEQPPMDEEALQVQEKQRSDGEMFGEEFQAGSEESQMVDEEQIQQRKIKTKKEVKIENEETIKLKKEYIEKQPQYLGIFQWNELQDIRHQELNEEESLLQQFQKEVREKGKIESQILLGKIKEKNYLKSVDVLGFGSYQQVFESVEEMIKFQQNIKIRLGRQKRYEFNFGEMRQVNEPEENIQFMSINLSKFDRNGENQNSNSRPLGQINRQKRKLQFVFNLFDGTIVGHSNLIQNMNERYLRYEQRRLQFFESLGFLLHNQIIEIETVKVSDSPYKNTDLNQVYFNTRAGSTTQNMNLWRRKMEANYEISFPLTLNLVKYYEYACREKIKHPLIDFSNIPGNDFPFNWNSDSSVFPMNTYRQIFRFISNHLRNVLLFLKKSKWDETIRNELNRLRLSSKKPSQINIPSEKDGLQDQQSEQEYNFDNLNANPNTNRRFPDQQISKEQLEKLFQSGNYFSLFTSKINPINPSSYFKGQLKQYQQVTLAWMLHRQNCKIDYKYERPQEHYRWINFHNIAQPIHINKETNQILNFIPFWKKRVNGGMLFDEMGLGKTVMSLALIDTHVKRQKKYPSKQAGTLVIVPTTVLSQWETKILQFLPHMSYVVISQGKDVKKQSILKSQIVLTTFSNIIAQMKKHRKYQIQNNETTLYDYDWFRIIIDEAHYLRNPKTQTAKYIQQLKRNYVWLLTGTPIQNKLSDLQSYFNLLCYSNHGLLKSGAKKGFLKSDKSLILIKSSLRDIMVRRKKNALDQQGKPILQLKQAKWVEIKIKLSPQEQVIYDRIQGIFSSALDQIIEEDCEQQEWDMKMPRLDRKIDRKIGAQANDSILHVFGKLMKLRQFCCHPELLYSKSNYIKYEKFTLHFQFFCKHGYDLNTFKNCNTQRKEEERQIFRRIFLDSNQVKRYLFKSKIHQAIMSRSLLRCTYCEEVIRNGLLTPCLHLYCEECFQDLWASSDKKLKDSFNLRPNQNRTRRYMFCYDKNCQEKIYNRQTLQLPRFNRFNKNIEDIQPNKKILELLTLIKETYPSEKIVVFTHFIGMIDILVQTMNKQMIPSLSVIGHDQPLERTEKIKAFRERQNIKVLVISTKCGHAGLNLEFANKMFFMEPWWNPAVEDQALGRIHRYGQQKQVEATRFLIEDSIEEMINLMGQQKKLLSDFILDSDSLNKRKKKIEILRKFKQMLDQKIRRNQNRRFTSNQERMNNEQGDNNRNV